MRFTWKPNKAATNLARHGVAFEAVYDFEWLTARVQGEALLRAYGLVGEDLYVLIYTLRRNTTFIISFRRANRKEVASYVSYATNANA